MESFLIDTLEDKAQSQLIESRESCSSCQDAKSQVESKQGVYTERRFIIANSWQHCLLIQSCRSIRRCRITQVPHREQHVARRSRGAAVSGVRQLCEARHHAPHAARQWFPAAAGAVRKPHAWHVALTESWEGERLVATGSLAIRLCVR